MYLYIFSLVFSFLRLWICKWRSFQRLPLADALTNINLEKNPHENICVEVYFLIKLQSAGPQLYYKRDCDTKCFPVTFAKFSRTAFSIEQPGSCFCLSLRCSLIEVYLEPCKTILTERCCKKNHQLQSLKYFCKKALS